jgi:hypothetical protein
MRGDKRAVIVICDSLRRDLIGERDTPFLVELSQRATAFDAHRSVFPSTTRASSASIATGCLPARHGLYGNTQALDEGDGLVCRNAGAPDFRERMRRPTGRSPSDCAGTTKSRSSARMSRPAPPISRTRTGTAISIIRPAATARERRRSMTRQAPD